VPEYETEYGQLQEPRKCTVNKVTAVNLCAKPKARSFISFRMALEVIMVIFNPNKSF
jgi:hypothetical protein